MRQPGLTSAARRGLSLIEVLVTIFVLAVGLFAVIRIVVPGLGVLPQAELRTRANVLAQHLARSVETRPDWRPDAIAHGSRITPSDPLSGWVLDHTVSMGDVDQISQLASTPGNPPTLVPAYPNLVIGEVFEMPMPLQTVIVECGPYVPGSLRVYYPQPYRQVEPGAEDDGSPANARRFSLSGTVITLDPWPGLFLVPGFMVCYSDFVGGVVTDVVGVTAVPVGNTIDLATYGATAPIPYSVSLYELAPGVVDESASPDLGRAGAIRFSMGAPRPGTELACMYEIMPHIRTGFDDLTITSFPARVELRDVAVPDILAYDTYVPIYAEDSDGDGISERLVKLPFDDIVRYGEGGGASALDATGPENVRVVNKLTGAIGVPGTPTGPGSVAIIEDGGPGSGVAGAGGYLRLDADYAALGPGTPIRVYYRVPGNWSVERHVAPAHFSMLDPVVGTFVPWASGGLKQYWYTVWVDTSTPEPYTTLVFLNIPAPTGPVPGRFEDYWSGGPLLATEADGHRVAVDYRYLDAAGNARRVSGETHLVDFVTHAITLNMPNVTAIESVRGISYKVRVCFGSATGRRLRVDVDTLAMR